MAGRHPPHAVTLPLMYQRWESFASMHWRYDPDVVQRLLPERLVVDTFDGAAWVGVTPFVVSGLRTPLTPVVPWLSHFPETNVRTYVRGPDGGDGVWFLSLEVPRLAVLAAARMAYQVPYRWARMHVDTGDVRRYRSRRRPPFDTASSDITVDVGRGLDEHEIGPLDNFLTGRWGAYTQLLGRLAYFRIEHEPWPLARASVRRLHETLIGSVGLPAPEGEPVVHASPGVHARIGPAIPLGRAI